MPFASELQQLIPKVDQRLERRVHVMEEAELKVRATVTSVRGGEAAHGLCPESESPSPGYLAASRLQFLMRTLPCPAPVRYLRRVRGWITAAAMAAGFTADLEARIGMEFQLGLGIPSDATSDPENRTDFLVTRDQYALSYNDDTHLPNWVGWSFSMGDAGSSGRTEAWAVEEALPPHYLTIGTATFGSGFDRGHMCPSGDRTASTEDNQFTFRMSNIVPQTARLNQGPWANFEDYCRSMAADGSEILIASGPSGFTGERLANGMALPGAFWKIAVKVPGGSGTAAVRVDMGTRVIAILMPNAGEDFSPWQSYTTSVEEIENRTGLRFLSDVDPAVAHYLRNVVDTGTGPNNPTVISSVSPASGGMGDVIWIAGHNFGTEPIVHFNGLAAEATLAENNLIRAVVPYGATTGKLTVAGAAGSDASVEEFAVIDGTLPVLALSTPIVGGLRGTPVDEAGTMGAYTLTGANLEAAVTVSAPPHFRISLDGIGFSESLVLHPEEGFLRSVPIHVRISPSAPVGAHLGTIIHSGADASPRELHVSGVVASSVPTLIGSTPALVGFTALPEIAGPSKAYALSGFNLSGSLTAAASSGFEISSENISFSPQLLVDLPGDSGSPLILHVRLGTGLQPGTYSGAVSFEGAGGVTLTLALSGSIPAPGTGTVSLASWEVSGLTGFGPSPHPPTEAATGVRTYGLSRGPGVATAGTAAANGWGGNGFDGSATAADAASRGDHFSFTIESDGWLELERIPAYNIRRSSTAPQTGQWQFRLGDGDFNDIGGPLQFGTTTTSSGNAQPAVDLSGEAELQAVPPGVSATFRLLAYDAGGAAGNLYINNIEGHDLGIEGMVSGSLQPPPRIVQAAATGTSYSPFVHQVTAFGEGLTFTATGLPEGLSIDPTTGLVSGVPVFPGQYPVLLTVAGDHGHGTSLLQVTIHPNAAAPLLDSMANLGGRLGEAFDQSLAATNNPAAILAKPLPPGLLIDPGSGHITGVPEAAGTYSVDVTAQNAFGSDSMTLVIEIVDPLSYDFVMRETYGLTGDEADRSADPDGDGWTNLQEFSFGLDPTRPGGSLTTRIRGEAGIGISYLQREGVAYTVEVSTDLKHWSPGGTVPALTDPQPSDLPLGCSLFEAWMPHAPGSIFIRVGAREIPR